MFCEKYYKKLLNYAKKDQIWADPNCPYRGSLCNLSELVLAFNAGAKTSLLPPLIGSL